MARRSARVPPGGSSSPLEEEQRRSWERTYEETPYDRLPWFSPRPSSWLVKVVADRWVLPRSSILDIGCGAGTNVLWLASKGFRASGLDLAPGAIAAAERRARRRGLSPKFRVGSALSIPFPRSAFDAAMDNGCFHALPLPHRRAYAAEVSRVIRPGGTLLLSWIAREETREYGPPHRPSLQEVTGALESNFIFAKTEFIDTHSRESRGPRGHIMSYYTACLVRRWMVQPPPR
jgi:SAM-dependent methyltransferase